LQLKDLILLGLLLSGFYGFAQSKQHFFNCAELNSSGSLILTFNFQVKDAQKPRVYQKQALTSVLYSGFNNRECGNQNPLLTTSEAQEKFRGIQKNFFSKKGPYLLFINDQTSGDMVKVEIKTKALQQYLLDQKIIEKLSHGF